ncbi:MAG: hypothetical protein SVP52_03790 [Chloroflexota bacterium]|nr:hypothetical protein [Chloroflexota bacterium]
MMDSEKIMSYLKDYRVTISVGVVLGLILGLVIGWGIWPVQWTDLAPYHLRQDLREDYLRMSIYTATTIGDGSVATKAWMELEDTAEETLEAVRNEPRYLSQQQITSFAAIVGAESIQVSPTTEFTEVAEIVEDQDQGGGPNWLLLGGLCLVLLVVAAAVIYFFILRDPSKEGVQKEILGARGRSESDYAFERDEQRFVSQHDPVPTAPEQTMPVAQFMTTYMVGDDLYDDSFSIDAPTGEFLGECGVGISETVGVGDPKRVTAFEVWLFDKNDIQTVTKVIMSAHAYDEDKIRMRLESKGEPVLAEPGKQVLLETATLQLEARVIDMEYGEGAAPDQSYFQRLTLELAIWPK